MDRSDAHAAFAKVPEVTLLFWGMKILATTLGETVNRRAIRTTFRRPILTRA